MTLREAPEGRVFDVCMHFPPVHKEIGATVASDDRGILWDKLRSFRWVRLADVEKISSLSTKRCAPLPHEVSIILGWTQEPSWSS